MTNKFWKSPKHVGGARRQGGLSDQVAATTNVLPTGSNEPAGMTTFCDLQFNAYLESPFTYSSWPTPISDPTSPHSPNNVLQSTINPNPPAWEGGPGMGDAYSLDPGVDGGRLYMRVYVKFVESDFQHHYNGIKMFYPFSYTHGHVFATYCDGLTGGSDYKTAYIMGKLYPQSGVGSQVFDQNILPSASVSRGVWHKIEVLWTANTPGTANGKYKYWLDGNLVSDYSDVGFYDTGETPRWWGMRFFQYGGGGADATITQTQHINYDGLYVSIGGPP